MRQNFADILEPFCNGPKTEVALINTVQVYCYEDTRIIKAFPQVLKVHFLLVVKRASHNDPLFALGSVQQRLYL